MTAKAPLQSFSFERREVGPQDMLIVRFRFVIDLGSIK